MTDSHHARVAERAAAERRVLAYLKLREEKPLAGIGDSIHSIHVGAEGEGAELLLSDLHIVMGLPPPTPVPTAADRRKTAR